MDRAGGSTLARRHRRNRSAGPLLLLQLSHGMHEQRGRATGRIQAVRDCHAPLLLHHSRTRVQRARRSSCVFSTARCLFVRLLLLRCVNKNKQKCSGDFTFSTPTSCVHRNRSIGMLLLACALAALVVSCHDVIVITLALRRLCAPSSLSL
jgi:hypothetical protein